VEVVESSVVFTHNERKTVFYFFPHPSHVEKILYIFYNLLLVSLVRLAL